jgi:hypothetical protein
MEIPDDDYVYRRIVPALWDERSKKIMSGAFYNYETSVDWSRHTTPVDSIKREPPGKYLAQVQAKYPKDKQQEVIYDPIQDNNSHSLIRGHKSESVRRYIRDKCEIILGPLDP